MKIREIMRPSTWIRADDTLWRTERIMARRRSKHLPVVDAGRLVGMISERDVIAFRVASSEPEWWLTPVRQIMRGIPTTAGPDDPVSVAAERIAGSPDALLPVVEHGFLIGVVTATDLLDAELRSWASSPGAITAEEVMTDALVTVAPTDPLIDAAMLMSDRQVRHLPVVENGAIVGMLSERDLLPVSEQLTGISEAPPAAPLSVRDAMTSDVVTVSSDTPITEISRTLTDRKIGAVPVVDDDRRPIGIVSYVDVLRALAA